MMPDARAFRPWIRDLGLAAMAGLTCGTGLEAARVAPMGSTEYLAVMGITAGCGLAGVSLLKRGLARWRGQRVERDVVAALRQQIPHATIRQGVKLWRGGDADAVVSAHGRKWVVEIKSQKGIVIHRSLMGSPSLRHASGRPARFKRDPIEQTLNAVHQVDRSAQGVLWLPCSSHNDSARIRGVTVVIGSARHLCRLTGMV
jgi:hypothetical protein